MDKTCSELRWHSPARLRGGSLRATRTAVRLLPVATLFALLLLTLQFPVRVRANPAWQGPHDADTGLVRIQKTGVLRWGGDLQGGEPYVFRDPRQPQRLVGFEVDVAESVARRLGVRAEFVQADWSTLLSSLLRGDFDVVINGLEVTPERARDFLLTRPYAGFYESLVVRQGERAPPADLEALVGERVGTLANSLAHKLLRATKGVRIVLYDGVEEPFIDLENGRLRAVLLDHVIAERYGLVRPDLVEAARLPGGTYAMAVRPQERSLWQALDQALAEMHADGELARILRAWRLPLPEEVESAPHAGPSHAEWSQQVGLFLRGAGVTIVLSVAAMALAMSLGLLLSAASEFGGTVARALVRGYVELFRGTPVLLQLYVLYYGLAPYLALDAWTTAIVGLGLNYAAYEAELYRAGFRAVPIGQREAALALGMSRWTTFRRIVLPQAVNVALPGMANDFIALLKDSSIVSVITVVELTKQMTITAVDLRSWLLPGAMCAALYLAMSVPLSRLARRLERRLAGER